MKLYGLVVTLSASQAEGRGFAPRCGHTIIEMEQTASLLGPQALG